MDPFTLENLLNLLNQICQETWAKLIFLLNSRGELVAYVGESPAFQPDGKRPPQSKINTNDGENLYFSQLKNGLYVGVLFEDEVPMTNVRGRVREHEEEFDRVLREYMPL